MGWNVQNRFWTFQPRTQNNYKIFHRNYRGSKTFKMKYRTAPLSSFKVSDKLPLPSNQKHPYKAILRVWTDNSSFNTTYWSPNGNTFPMLVRLKWPPCLWFLCYSVIISYEYTNLVDMKNYKVKKNNKQVIVDSAKIQLIPEKVWIMFCTL